MVSGGGVASVDGEELALDEGSKVVDPVDALDVGDANVLEGVRSTTHSKNFSSVTSSPALGSWAGTILSMAELA
ncbi:hypothetical protein SNK04_011998 [Fusarium graminearum]